LVIYRTASTHDWNLAGNILRSLWISTVPARAESYHAQSRLCNLFGWMKGFLAPYPMLHLRRTLQVTHRSYHHTNVHNVWSLTCETNHVVNSHRLWFSTSALLLCRGTPSQVITQQLKSVLWGYLLYEHRPYLLIARHHGGLSLKPMLGFPRSTDRRPIRCKTNSWTCALSRASCPVPPAHLSG
jgi:hypothetical protein